MHGAAAWRYEPPRLDGDHHGCCVCGCRATAAGFRPASDPAEPAGAPDRPEDALHCGAFTCPEWRRARAADAYSLGCGRGEAAPCCCELRLASPCVCVCFPECRRCCVPAAQGGARPALKAAPPKPPAPSPADGERRGGALQAQLLDGHGSSLV